MVTTADEEPQPIGAVAAFGGKVEDFIASTTKRVSYGETRLLTPLVLILLTLVPVLLTENVWLAALGVVSLFALTVWSVVEVVRTRK